MKHTYLKMAIQFQNNSLYGLWEFFWNEDKALLFDLCSDANNLFGIIHFMRKFLCAILRILYQHSGFEETKALIFFFELQRTLMLHGFDWICKHSLLQFHIKNNFFCGWKSLWKMHLTRCWRQMLLMSCHSKYFIAFIISE